MVSLPSDPEDVVSKQMLALSCRQGMRIKLMGRNLNNKAGDPREGGSDETIHGTAEPLAGWIWKLNIVNLVPSHNMGSRERSCYMLPC
jgi:hypothetical protein